MTHALIQKANEFLEVLHDQTFSEEIARIQQDTRRSDKNKRELTEARHAYREGKLGDMILEAFDSARGEYNTIKSKRRDVFMAAQLNDKLDNANMREDAHARLRQARDKADTFQEFEQGYDTSFTEGDAYLTRAYQTGGRELAAERWPHEPGVGHFGERLSREYREFFEGSEGLELKSQLATLHDATRAWVAASQEFWREHAGSLGIMGSPARGIATEFEGLNSEISSELGYGGVSGGYYEPAPKPKWVIQAAGPMFS